MKARVLVPLVVAIVAFAAPAFAEAGWVGKKLPDFTVNYLGAKPDLAGKPMLLEFWATWCPPCRKSIPHLNELWGKYKDRGLEIVGVTDEPAQKVRSFMRSMPMDYHVASDTTGRLGEKLGVTGIPHAFLVNKEGVIVWEGHPMSLTDAEVEKVLE